VANRLTHHFIRFNKGIGTRGSRHTLRTLSAHLSRGSGWAYLALSALRPDGTGLALSARLSRRSGWSCLALRAQRPLRSSLTLNSLWSTRTRLASRSLQAFPGSVPRLVPGCSRGMARGNHDARRGVAGSAERHKEGNKRHPHS